MTAIHIIIWIIILLFFAIQIISLIALNDTPDVKEGELNPVPKVSVLLAARNEEKLILRNLTALAAMDYPLDKLEVLIGDDDSTDKTHDLVQDFIKDKPNFKLYKITEVMGKGRGKANVLAHLAHEAEGEYYFVTDVDVKLPPQWIREMLAGFEPKVGILSGTTMCATEPNTFAMLQGMDWLHFMGYIKSFGNWGIGCTSVGNNMAVRAEAYWQTGGFENIDFSITEDYKLFQAVTRNGWEWRTLLSPESLGKAYYIPQISEMLHQRKRWLIGARDLPPNWKAMIVLYGLFIPAIIGLAIIDPRTALVAWLVKFLLQSLFIFQLTQKVNEKPFKLGQLVMYEIYVLLNTAATAVFYTLPFASKWKGRTYNKAYIE